MALVLGDVVLVFGFSFCLRDGVGVFLRLPCLQKCVVKFFG